MIRILSIDKTAGLSSSHERHQATALQPKVKLHVLGPRHWIENGREIWWQPRSDAAYVSHPGKVFFKDYYARVGYYSGLSRALYHSRPHIIQLFEEPWSITALQTVIAAAMIAPTSRICFYTWENYYRPWVYPARASLLYAAIDKMLHCVSAGAVCATEGARSVLLKKGYSHPTAVIPYGIPEFFFQGSIPVSPNPRPFTIGYIGRLMFMKGIDLLLNALAALPDCRLLLVGAGEDADRYRSQAQNLGIAERIEWILPRPESEIPNLLQRMNVFVLPSRRVEGWMEQLGRVAVEAMAVGVPVIGARSGAIPEVLADAGLLFEENSVSDLTQKIRYIMEHPEVGLQLSRAGRERARAYFTWTRFAEKICAFYNSLLNE